MPPTTGTESPANECEAAQLVRQLAREGTLAQRFAATPATERARLTSGAYHIAWPVVFERLTRGLEHRRGHHHCAANVHQLEPACLDAFYGAVEAAIHDLLCHATKPIRNLEGWIASRLVPATVDHHRRQRGERGALQRPRLPRWLVEALDDDPWLTVLALEILIWVGVPASAGTDTWPWDAWTERRAVATHDPRSTEAETAKDVETVLGAMRRRQGWYERYVERPLGRKQAPVLSLDAADFRRCPHESIVGRSGTESPRLLELASLAIDAIQLRLRRGEEPSQAVATVLRLAFSAGTGAEDIDRAPEAGSAGEDDPVGALLIDTAALDRLVSQVLSILADGSA